MVFLFPERMVRWMFRIVQVFNNNVALVRTQEDKQAIVMGKGISFRKERGNLIQADKVEKTFVLRDETAVNDLTTLLKNVPIDFVTISYDLIDQAQKKYNYQVEDYIYVTLTTHLYGVYQRLTDDGKTVNYLPDLSDDYPIPYAIAKDILNELGHKLGVEFPEQEQKSVALHFINAHIVDEKNKASQSEEKVDELVNLFKKELNEHGIKRSQSPINYDRLIVHLKYFVARLDDEKAKENAAPIAMVNGIKYECPDAWKITDQITQEVSQRLKIKISPTEQIYLTLHIQRLLNGGFKK